MKKYTVDLAKIPLYYPGAVKPVKRSYSKKTKTSKPKVIKSSSKGAKSKKAPRIKAAKTSKVSTKAPKTTKARKAPSRTREQIAAEAEAKRQARFDAYTERQAAKQFKEYEKYINETEKQMKSLMRDAAKAEREFLKLEREHNKQVRDEERAKKARQITENKMRSQGMDPSNYRENILSMISNKAGDFAFTTEDYRDELANILDINTSILNMPLKERKESIYEHISRRDMTEDELTALNRKLETFDRVNRLHAKGIEESMDVLTATRIMSDIMSSDKVSAETKAVLRLLGPKGALIYTNYRQIQFQKYGKNYKEQFYSEAASTFWDTSSADKIALKKHGYKVSNKMANLIKDSRVGLSTNIDAESFAKFAITTMNLEEATAFTQQLEGLDGFGKNLRVTYYNGKRVVR